MLPKPDRLHYSEDMSLRRTISILTVLPVVVALLFTAGCTIKGPDGSRIKLGKDGAQFTDGDGSSISVGGSVKLPDGFPSEVPLVKGTIVQASYMADDNAYAVSVRVDKGGGDLWDTASGQLTAAGFEASDTHSAQGGQNGVFSNNNWRVNITTIESDDGEGLINYVVLRPEDDD